MFLSLFRRIFPWLRRRFSPPALRYIGGSDILPPPLDKAREEAALSLLMQGDAEAKKLLASSDMKIVDICFACGVNDASYFAKKFKFSEGISPSEYRKLHKRR